jgi:hypothetical protein
VPKDWYWPSGQIFEQLDDPTAEKLPEEHASQATAPEAAENMLIAQLEQTAARALGWYMPAVHWAQVLESEAPDESEAVPAAQPAHEVAPDILEYDPAEQAEHALAAATAEYWPAAHCAQLEDPEIA